ncbi:methylthioribulose-1-phosphate dehydratase [Bacillus mesophilus]|uniref:Methylthioribulose-1-phosphate dehydratase n=1 Tax=Bacillus mesophilus TaxID=1808955 RepID=A0A6M0Q2I6_9BACI|nr:methylthioribulose 1-phosphate dehydratase [Bacillus mesophilus]MBM7659648.1 methylthioribulose-1-phosphate dehydratase [Bacillus mesophilus]NEY70516.1 methylthioribulose 1-phosphate dehydratase [Bacillus mesophilus]
MSAIQERWNELADIKDELAWRDWFPGTSGNLSIKVTEEPLTFLVTASGKDKRKRTEEDFLLVNNEGLPVENTHLKPSAETLLHTEVYNRTKAACCLHVHTVDNNVMSDLFYEQGEIVFQKQELIKAFGLWEEDATFTVPIIYNHAHIPTLTQEFIPHITGDTGAVLIQNHGITVWGRTPLEAKRYLEACEFLFSFELKRLMLKNIR